MADEWAPFAQRDTHAWRNGTMARNTGALRVVLHDTESDVGTNPYSIANWMANNGAKLVGGYHLLVPLTNSYKPLQMRPADVAAGSLRNNSSLARSPNKEGTRLIAISLICRAADNHGTKDLGPWWPNVLAWVRSLGVPDVIVGGRLPPGGGGLNKIPVNEWYSSQSGWCFHATAPNPPSAHWDPGKVDPAVLFAQSAPQPQPPQPQPQPPQGTVTLQVEGSGTVSLRMLKKGHEGRDVRQMQALLEEWAISPGKHDGIFGSGTDSAVRKFQQSKGYAQDGIVGSTTWTGLLGR